MIHIRTNRNWREFQYRSDVPSNVISDHFDHLDADDIDGFLKYRDRWYHVSDFTRVGTGILESGGWHGATGDSYFSGVVIRISEDGEQYQVGTYLS